MWSNIVVNMPTVIPSTNNNISLTPGLALITKKSNFLPRCSIFQKLNKQKVPVRKYVLPLSTSLRLFPQFTVGCSSIPKRRTHISSAMGTDAVVEEVDLSLGENGASGNEVDDTEISGESSAKSDNRPSGLKRSRPVRKSEMPPVKNEELVPGATFAGKVRSIQPFGAFVDFGAFTDGLVHVSRLSDSFVKDVSSVVTVGQEVTVRLLEVNMETGRISLTMRESDDPNKVQQQKDAPISSDKTRPPRNAGPRSNQKKEERKSSKFVKGQDLAGTVKNLTRAGAFISLPEGEEGFLPTSEEADEGFGNFTGGSSLEVGQEVNVRVLRITRGQVTLTMKKEEDVGELDAKLNQGVVHTATNPFMLAFRSNEVISAFLDEREKQNEQDEKSEESGENAEAALSPTENQVSEALDKEEDQVVPDTENNDVRNETINELEISSVIISDELSATGQISAEPSTTEEAVEKPVDDPIAKDKENSETQDETVPSDTQLQAELSEEPSLTDATENQVESKFSGELTDQVLSDTSEEIIENTVDEVIAKDEDQGEQPEPSVPYGEEAIAPSYSEGNENIESTDQTLSVVAEEVSQITANDVIVKDEDESSKADSTKPSALQGEEETAIQNPEENGGTESTVTQTTSPDLEITSAESEVSQEANGDLGDDTAVKEVEKQTSGVSQENGNALISSDVDSTKETITKATVSPALVKQLREETGAGMMDCKKALAETGGDLVKAHEYLRIKGLASADKKASRATAEGRIGSYIHDSRIGVLIEVNCETDFVARGDIFKELVEDLAMQAAACPQVQYLNTEDVPQEVVDKEREIEMQKEDLLSKPEQIRSKIVDGRINKRLEELALLEQPFIKDDKITVKDWVKQTISTIGENIKVKRFVRYNLGEGLEKKAQDFAAEVAAQTAAKPMPTPVTPEPAPAETKESIEKQAKPVVSAALVKQLREETGAGMMDCKKALAETGGDLEKAHEYLRKKGLASADKKSSRLAAEGRIGSYIHDSRIGVLIEVNCETDFVGRGENFKELVDDLAMQVAASPQVQYVSVEDIPESIVAKEKELEMQREDLQSKPENIREKIVEGRVAKRLGDLALLEQPFIKNDGLLVKDLVKQTIAGLGENIKVRRFVRFTLGEAGEANLEDKA